MYHARLRPGKGWNFAECIYQSMGLHIRSCADRLVAMKGSVAVNQRDLAHPNIPDHRLLEFLSRLGSDEEGLEPHEVSLFDFLKSTSTTVENIACAARGG
jgi:hypothetical protein